MPREEIRLPRHFWRWRIALVLLIMHLFVFGAAWISAYSRASNIEYVIENAATIASTNYVSVVENQLLAVLFWTPILIFHIGAHLYLAGRSDAGSGERQAYREGFRDGTHYAADDRYDARRLEIDDDGELLEFPSGGKQKRR